MKKTNANQSKNNLLKKYAQMNQTQLFEELQSQPGGLASDVAQIRFAAAGPNKIAARQPQTWWQLLIASFNDPFSFVLVGLMVVSLATSDGQGAVVMALMVILSASIRFVQSFRSQTASIALKQLIANTCTVYRDEKLIELPIDQVVVGDVVVLSTGDMIPADACLISTRDLFVNQSTLTGESMPVEKSIYPALSTENNSFDYPNLVFMGTDVLSGSAKAVILKTGQQTYFGDIALHAAAAQPQTQFDQGMRQVSRLLIGLMLILVPCVFIINGLTKHDWWEAFFFAIAVAVGLTPEMLPMVVNSNLAKGALSLSHKKVIIKSLSAIQNLGGMNILCTDKTGTITEDRVVLVRHVGADGLDNTHVLRLAYLNAHYQTGWKNLMDQAVIQYFDHQIAEEIRGLLPADLQKLDEIPFDFDRRRLTVVLKNTDHEWMITKGAFEEMMAVCNKVEFDNQIVAMSPKLAERLKQVHDELADQGMRVLTLAYKLDVHSKNIYVKTDENHMVLAGFMGFLDPAKTSAKTALTQLQQHGVTVKVLTGDNAIVSQHVANEVGLKADECILGEQIEAMDDGQLKVAVMQHTLFVKLSPLQKSRIILALKQAGNTVGFMGDGINDAPALRQADIGISVDTAADITKEASSVILLEKNLQVLCHGILEGRRVYINTMKYLKMTISSNFGNALSILIASLILPFLPMLSIQILVQNLIYDTAQMAIPWDNVDPEDIQYPTPWNIHGLLSYTLIFGPISSLFDLITFGFMWFDLSANTTSQQAVFQTGWFIVGLFTQSLVIFIFRTRKLPLLQSHASRAVQAAALSALIIGIFIVATPIRHAFGFSQLPNQYWPIMGLIVVGYLSVVQLIKHFYRKATHQWL